MFPSSNPFQQPPAGSHHSLFGAPPFDAPQRSPQPTLREDMFQNQSLFTFPILDLNRHEDGGHMTQSPMFTTPLFSGINSLSMAPITSLQSLMGAPQSIFQSNEENSEMRDVDRSSKDHGEVIPSKNHTHHSVPDDLAELIPYQKCLNLQRESIKALVDDRGFIHSLTKDTGLIEIYSDDHILQTLQSDDGNPILDLVLLPHSHIAYMTEQFVKVIKVDSQETVFTQDIQHQYERLQASANHYLVLSSRENILVIKTSSQERKEFKFSSIVDTFLSQQQLLVLHQGNEVTCITLANMEITYKSSFRDATGTIERLFYLDPTEVFTQNEATVSFQREHELLEEEFGADAYVRDVNNKTTSVNEDEEDGDVNRFIDDEVVDDDDEDEAPFLPSIEMGGGPGGSLRGLGGAAGSRGILGGVQMREKRLPLFKSATQEAPNVPQKSIQPGKQQQQSLAEVGVTSCPISGFLLLLETQAHSSNGSSTLQRDNAFILDQQVPRRSFLKLSLVKIVNKGSKQELQLQSYLKLSDKQLKHAYFDAKRGVIILVNQDVNSDGRIIMHLVKLAQILQGQNEKFNSDSEEEQMSPGPHGLYPIGIKFQFIRKLRLDTDSERGPQIIGFQVKKSFNSNDDYTLVNLLSNYSVVKSIITYQHSLQKNDPAKIAFKEFMIQPPRTPPRDTFTTITARPDTEEQIDDHRENTALEGADNVSEGVSREINEAIEKELQFPLIINEVLNEQEEAASILPSSNKEDSFTPSEEKKEEDTQSVQDQPAQPSAAPLKQGGAGEIKLPLDVFKQATQKGVVPPQQPPSKKKKKKEKKKEAANAGNTTPTNAKSRNHSPEQQKPPVAVAKAPEPSKAVSSTLIQSTSQKTLDNVPPKQNSGGQTQAPTQQQPQQQQTQQIAQAINQQSSASKKQKALQEVLLENFTELTKKYQELSQKFQKVQDQLSNQSDKQQELEKNISQNLQKYLPTLVESQLKEQVVPLVLQHVKSIDKKVKEDIMPVIETQLQDIVVKLVRQNKLASNKDSSPENNAGVSKFILDTNAQNQIRQLVVDEFTSAMDTAIKPVLKDSLISVVKDVQSNLSAVSADFAQRIAADEERNSEIIEKISEKVEALQNQLNNQSNLSPGAFSHHQYPPHPSVYGGYYPHHPLPPPPQYPYGYPPYPQYSPQPPYPNYAYPPIPPPQISYQMSSRESVRTNLGTREDIYSERERMYQNPYPQGLPPHIHDPYHNPQQIGPVSSGKTQQKLKKSENENQGSRNQQDIEIVEMLSRKLPSESQAILMAQKLSAKPTLQKATSGPSESPGQLAASFSFNPPLDKQVQNQTHTRVKAFKMSDEQNVYYVDDNNEDEDSEEQKISKRKKQSEVQHMTTSSNSDSPGGAANNSSQPKGGAGEQARDESKINWQFLPYIKDIATKAKLNQADFLLCGSEQFLKDAILTVQNNSRIITNQYKGKIIHQFIKKVYQRAKEHEKARPGALQIINVFIDKIYKERPEMKQAYIQQAVQWEEDIKKLLSIQ